MSTDLSVDGPRVEVLGGAGEPEEAPAPRGVERLPVRGDGEPPPAPALAPLLPLLVQLHPALKLLPLHLQGECVSTVYVAFSKIKSNISSLNPCVPWVLVSAVFTSPLP